MTLRPFVALLAGILFGAGLALSGMIDPARVLSFLDLAALRTGQWDPTLAFVMAGALVPSAIGYAMARRRTAPLLGDALAIPPAGRIDRRLIGGAILFGVGWGLVGLCPGPALAALPLGGWPVFVFVAALVTGMALHDRIGRVG